MKKGNTGSYGHIPAQEGAHHAVGGVYDPQQMKIKKKDLIKMQQTQQEQYMHMQHDNQAYMRQQMAKQGVQQAHHGQGVAYVNSVASKGATGRKGSLPLNYPQPQPVQQIAQQHQAQSSSQEAYIGQMNQHRQSQPTLQNRMLEQNVQPIQVTASNKGNSKVVKSHAKYFSQQNSPVDKDSKHLYQGHHQHQQSHGMAGQPGIILSSSGAGIIGIESSFPNAGRGHNEHQKQHQVTGSFGAGNQVSGGTEPRAAKNYSQLSQHSHGSGAAYLNQQQKQYANSQEAANLQAKHFQQMQMAHPGANHHYGGGYPNQQTSKAQPQGANMIQGNPGQPGQMPSNQAAKKAKQKYDESYLNGPLGNHNNDEAVKRQLAQQMQAKRVINNQSQQASVNFDESLMGMLTHENTTTGHHKRIGSTQQSNQQQSTLQQMQRASTSAGNYAHVSKNATNMMNKTDTNYHPKAKQKFVQPSSKSSLEKSQELFQKSGHQHGFLNSNSIVMGPGERSIKHGKKQAKASTRPGSNQKVRHYQNQAQFMNESTFQVSNKFDNQVLHSKKMKNTAQTAGNSLNERKHHNEAQSSKMPQKRQSPQTFFANSNSSGQIVQGQGNIMQKYNNMPMYYQPDTNSGSQKINQNSASNLVTGAANNQYYGGGGKVMMNDPNMQSQGAIPMIQGQQHQGIPVSQSKAGNSILSQQQIKQMKNIVQTTSKQVVSVPKTMLHKSNKMMNNYLKQATIPQPEPQPHAQIQNKRMSTGTVVNNAPSDFAEKDTLSFSMKKKNFHHRAETQLKNSLQQPPLQYQQLDMLMKEGDLIGGGNLQEVVEQQNSFLVLPQNHHITTMQSNVPTAAKSNQTNINAHLKYQNSKSQKSSTSRLINSSSTQGRFNQSKQTGSGQSATGGNTAGSSDRLALQKKQASQMQSYLGSNNMLHQESVNMSELNYGGQKAQGGLHAGAASSSSKNSLKQKGGGKLNTLQYNNQNYPYQSSSTKSGKNISMQSKQMQNLSIAQIFQQKGLSYKGPSKVMINQGNSQKVAHKMGPNGVIVHTKGINNKGALTTSANTAQNSPRGTVGKGGLHSKNSSNAGQLRRKPSTASIAGASLGGGASAQGQSVQKSTTSTKANRQQNVPQESIINRSMRTTSHGGAFKKATGQLKQGQNPKDEVGGYHEEVQATEVAAYDGSDKLHQLEPSKLGNYQHVQNAGRQRQAEEMYHRTNSQERILNDADDENIHLLESEKASMRAVHEKQKSVDKFVGKAGHIPKKNSLHLGNQSSGNYIADNGGTGSNPAHQHPVQRGVAHHDFYTQNQEASASQIKQKKNQHSYSLGNMQQLEQLQGKHLAHPPTGPSPSPQVASQLYNKNQAKIEKKSQSFLQSAAGAHKGDGMKEDEEAMKQGPQPGEFVFRDDEAQYNKQLKEMLDAGYDVGGPAITEEEEQEIRQVASDINEKAFYGKVLKAKQIISSSMHNGEQKDKQIKNLSPRSQEIAHVMGKILQSFKRTNSAPETEMDFYRIGKMLGRGAFGKVNLAMHKLVRKLVALKSLNKECLTDEVQKQKLMKEVNLLLKLRHDHVVKIYETIETKKHIIIVMELCAGGDLLNYVRKRRRLKEPYAKKIFKQIVDGLKYIHSKYVGHRDIKLDNILLDGKGSVKIADFGVSKQCQPGAKMREQCGTPAYIAPEILRNKHGYTFSVDLWSAGVVLFAMLYGTVPFKASSMEELHSLILRGIYTLKEDISPEARSMLRGLLEINPHKRLTVEEIYKHPWLQDYDESLQLFNDQEREMIRKEYTYNDPSRYNRNENEEPVDCFTEHNIDSVYNTLKNASEKSIILAPFNSTQSEDFEMFKQRIRPMMFEKNLVLRLSRLCREIDRQYEFNNNGQLDNGVYHKQINNTDNNSQGSDKKKKKKENSDDDEDESRFQVLQCSKSGGMDFLTVDYVDIKKEKKALARSLMANLRDEEKGLLESNFASNKDMKIEPAKLERLVSFGYPTHYVKKSLQDNLPNYVTAGYYLLQMDQNYC